MENNKTTPLFFIKTAAPLMIITTAVAVLLAVINMLTAPVIEQHDEEARKEAVAALFPEATYFESIVDLDGIAENLPDSILNLFAVYQDEAVIGFTAEVTEMGFAEYVNMMIGIGADQRIRGIQILSINDTPGIGQRVAEPDYLAGYTGLAYPVTFTSGANHADAISGATYSSRAILNGVNDALAFCSRIVVTEAPAGEEAAANE
ncbi:MAG: FMN-binding protein [Clostridia bacterium]|nr:FMN-binding protein [Clostridia bacterium]